MRWSERPPVVRSRLTSLQPFRFGPRALSVAVAHLILVRSMQRALLLAIFGIALTASASRWDEIQREQAARVGIDTGLSSISFALAAVFAAVVMYDAAGVRRAVSLQARVLNRMLTEMLEAQLFNEERLRELIGHTPFEVFVGALLGALSALSLR